MNFLTILYVLSVEYYLGNSYFHNPNPQSELTCIACHIQFASANASALVCHIHVRKLGGTHSLYYECTALVAKPAETVHPAVPSVGFSS